MEAAVCAIVVGGYTPEDVAGGSAPVCVTGGNCLLVPELGGGVLVTST